MKNVWFINTVPHAHDLTTVYNTKGHSAWESNTYPHFVSLLPVPERRSNQWLEKSEMYLILLLLSEKGAVKVEICPTKHTR